ncbi:MepB family protein [uncultured Polaribacter sp.]|uniref:MepB family protein n=1 Tax=uncultured Polaribacter sp. TaxID=174711 RepID=UPI002629BC26|nr:MepB family protein [uncultured Polaribacter sp.]
MNSNLKKVEKEIYEKCSLKISDFKKEPEGKVYDACQFKLNGMNIICRSSKITPKKVGQFVTFWRRNEDGITEPFNENQEIDFYVINVNSENNFGQFVFPKSELIKKGIILTGIKDGKRGFRVYPSWSNTNNKQAERTQKWQLEYFYEINNLTDLNEVSKLYRVE